MSRLKALFIVIASAILVFAAVPSFAKKAPKVITIGTLYASSGPFATSSTPQYEGLKFWVSQVNKEGGVFVKAFNKKIPVKLVAYDDQSKTATAGMLYNQLITRDHVDMLAADFGSVLTSVAVPLAKVHKVMLFDQTGTAAKFFTPDNPYVVLCSLPTSGKWPYALADFMIAKKIPRVAILYASNDFDQSQAVTLHDKLVKAGIKPVYYQAVPTSTSNYSVLIHSIQATKPDAVIEFGFPNNDIAFLQGLQASGVKFKMVFTIFPGQLFELLEKNVGAKALYYTYTYPTPPLLKYEKVDLGMGLSQFEQAFKKETGKEVNFLNVAGYNTGLIMQKTLETAPKFDQLAFRKAVTGFSGKLMTLDGKFEVDANGAQVGEMLPVAQFVPKGVGGIEMHIVYPPNMKTAEAVYPAP
ncbi:MAG: ABC transporter substrate-binding protein [Deltaproteobacteria bacterium]|jgi:branched-chain amino acid transport system substrate-binding protein|nr:ABC transporter substrate-binding protein [Deltaproteobacteria bacterium]MDA8305654.1 ABC transporter substrate-binding protein [Deltaproteobacteria bacterium]